MYQILVNTADFSNKLFAANVPEKEVDFIKDEFCYDGGFTRFDVDVYNERVSAKSYEDYGRFCAKSDFLEWLYLNVFKHDYKNLDEFKQHYTEQLAEFQEENRVKNICLDILYNDYTAGWENERVYDRLYPYIIGCIMDDNQQRPDKKYLRRAIRRAFVSCTLINYKD